MLYYYSRFPYTALFFHCQTSLAHLIGKVTTSKSKSKQRFPTPQVPHPPHSPPPQVPRYSWADRVMRNYLLPQGYPYSVGTQYTPYMTWRGVQYFFGGAIAVYTTKSLLGALGVGGKYTGEAAAAINWVLKDGAGRCCVLSVVC